MFLVQATSTCYTHLHLKKINDHMKKKERMEKIEPAKFDPQNHALPLMHERACVRVTDLRKKRQQIWGHDVL